MKKSDGILIVTLLIINTLIIFNTLSGPSSLYANVYYDNNLVMELDLTVDDSYSVDAVNGEVEVTVKNQKVAITKETSPLNICAKQGYVDVSKMPLICLPNKVVVEGVDVELDGVAR